MAQSIKQFYLILMILFLAGSGPARASSGAPESEETAHGGNFLSFYKTVISATDGDRCGMSPSCSSYAARAFKKHGFFLGWIMSCDRLIRCGRDETRLSSHIRSGNRILTVDTLEDNDFWWYP
ncbi:membrane protein insertion efficiency factor YidD [Desulfocicer niacini]